MFVESTVSQSLSTFLLLIVNIFSVIILRKHTLKHIQTLFSGVYAAHDPNGGGDDNSLGDLEDDELTREKVKSVCC